MDINTFQFLHNGISFGVIDFKDYSNLEKWYKNLSECETMKTVNSNFDGMAKHLTKKE